MKPFGTTADGIAGHLYTLENEYFRLEVTDYACSLVSLVYKPLLRDVLLGYKSVSGYTQNRGSLGAIIGRVCNRIGQASFELSGNTYKLTANNGPHNLHSGPVGFNKRFFEMKQLDETTLIGTIDSADGDQGFPGHLICTITYHLEKDGLRYTYEATSDQDTLCNITNHAYWNLDGQKTVLDTIMCSPASHVLNTDDYGNPTGPIQSVDHTVFDFRTPSSIGKRIDSDELSGSHGYDHPYLVEGKGLRQMAHLEGHDLCMDVLSDLPGFQFYIGNHLTGKETNTKTDEGYMPYSGFCIETQYAPDAIHRNDVEQPILRSGRMMKHETLYRFSPKETV